MRIAMRFDKRIRNFTEVEASDTGRDFWEHLQAEINRILKQ